MIKHADIDITNQIISNVITDSTATLRFPQYMNNDLVGLISSLVPIPKLHFLFPSLTPVYLNKKATIIKKTTVLDVMRRLLQTKNHLADVQIKTGLYISILNIIQGEVESSEIHKSIIRIRERKIAEMIEWGPASFQVTVSKKSQYVDSPYKIQGLMLGNHTSIRQIVQFIQKNHEQLFKRNAYLENYQAASKFSDNYQEFD